VFSRTIDQDMQALALSAAPGEHHATGQAILPDGSRAPVIRARTRRLVAAF
jgi:hypothetical protein